MSSVSRHCEKHGNYAPANFCCACTRDLNAFSTSAEVEAFFAPGFALHGKVISGSGQMGNHYFLTFTDGTELHFRVEEDRDGVRLKVSAT